MLCPWLNVWAVRYSSVIGEVALWVRAALLLYDYRFVSLSPVCVCRQLPGYRPLCLWSCSAIRGAGRQMLTVDFSCYLIVLLINLQPYRMTHIGGEKLNNQY